MSLYWSTKKYCIWLVAYCNLELIFCLQDCHCQCRIARVEYQGQTRYTKTLDCKLFINTCYHIRHRLELIFSLCTIFAQCSKSSLSTLAKWDLRTWKIGQIFGSHFPKVDELIELLYEHWAKIVQTENISTPTYVQCYKMYEYKVWCQEFWNILSGLDIQLEPFQNDKLARQKSVQGLLDVTSHIPVFCWIDINSWISAWGKL